VTFVQPISGPQAVMATRGNTGANFQPFASMPSCWPAAILMFFSCWRNNSPLRRNFSTTRQRSQTIELVKSRYDLRPSLKVHVRLVYEKREPGFSVDAGESIHLKVNRSLISCQAATKAARLWQRSRWQPHDYCVRSNRLQCGRSRLRRIRQRANAAGRSPMAAGSGTATASSKACATKASVVVVG